MTGWQATGKKENKIKNGRKGTNILLHISGEVFSDGWFVFDGSFKSDICCSFIYKYNCRKKHLDRNEL